MTPDLVTEPDLGSVQKPASEHSPDPDLLPRHKPNNPFANGKYMSQTQSPDSASIPALASPSAPTGNATYTPTSVPVADLRHCVFKTSNRILDDLRFTPALAKLLASGECAGEVTSLLNARPIDYAQLVSSRLAHEPYDMLVLNNALSHIPSVSRVELEDKQMVSTTIRGLIVSRGHKTLHHFRIQILEKSSRLGPVDKHEFHLVSRDMLSADDQSIFGLNYPEAPLDDAFYKSLNNASNYIMRVSIFGAEFTEDDLLPITDQELIKDRYLKGVELNPSTALSADTIPQPVHCFQTLLKVLKGPIVLPPNEVVHTISKTRTSLDAKIDLKILFSKLSFKLGDDQDSLIPPDLSKDPALKESYIRKAYELVFLGKGLKTKNMNDFDVSYSFSDSLSQVHSVLAEVDKHAALTMTRTDNSNKLAFFVALSCYTFFQDEVIIRCFEHTHKSDPKNKMRYVDCFKNIMSYRSSSNSGRLQSYYNNQYMKGQMYGYSDYRTSLKALGIEAVNADTFVDDEAIIEMYKTACKSDPKNYTYYNKQLLNISAISASSALEHFLQKELVPGPIALEELRIEEVTEDEVVVTAYEFRLDELVQVESKASGSEIAFLQKCLLSIAVGRKSYILMTYIEKNIPDLLQETGVTFADALAVLHVEQTTSDFEIISKFQECLTNSTLGDPVDIRVLRQCLGVIAENRKSEVLFSFLSQGQVDASLLPPENWPAGLDNIGNTCYLNSLLQYYFCIRPIRDTILTFDESNVDTSKYESRKIGGRYVEDSELERSFQFVYRLLNLFGEMISTKKRCVQPSKELAYLSFLPLSQSVHFKGDGEEKLSELRDEDKENEFVEIEKVSDEADMEVDDFDALEEKPVQLDACDERSSEENDMSVDVIPQQVGTLDLLQSAKLMSINAEQMESTIEVGRQQDVTECIENVTFQIETALAPEHIEEDGEQFDLVKKLFCGKTKQTITPMEGETQQARSSVERFFSLIINVGDHPKDLYDAMDNYFSEDIVDLEEGKVKKSLTILKLPEILQFHVQRVMFDRERLMAYKSLEVIPFGETIYLDRYLETDDQEIIKKKQEVFEWKSEMKKLREEKEAILKVDPDTKLSILDALNATIKFLNSKVLEHELVSVQKETLDALQAQVDIFKMRLQAIHTRLDTLQGMVSSQFNSYQRVGYSLFAIFIHRGEASYGHYWVYIKDPVRNIYRKYNDDTVTEVPASEVLNFTDSNTATPYYMAYVKSELERDYVEPLKREFA